MIVTNSDYNGAYYINLNYSNLSSSFVIKKNMRLTKKSSEIEKEFMSFGRELGINETELERLFFCATKYAKSVKAETLHKVISVLDDNYIVEGSAYTPSEYITVHFEKEL